MRSPSAILLLTVLAVASSWGADARVAAQNAGQVPPLAVRQPGPSRPAVDPLTGSIDGRVTTLDSGAPIRRAEVRVTASNGYSRFATSDGDGRFTLRNMPAGDYRVTITKSGFVTLAYGQRRPFEAAIVVNLKQGQQFTVNMSLPRAGAIAGRVYDEAGEPLAAVRVQALRARIVEGRRRLEPTGAADVTDDTGSFRLYGLGPSDYYVAATAPARVSQRREPSRDPYPPVAGRTTTVFYPGTTSIDDAQRVTLGGGEEARADVQIVPAGAATVSGIVLRMSGEPAVDAAVTLRSEIISIGPSAQAGGTPPMTFSGHTTTDGTFMLFDVPPGSYTLQATAQDLATMRMSAGPGPSGGPPRFDMPPLPESAFVPVTVNGDLDGLTLGLTQGGSVEGVFVADAGVTAALPTGLNLAPQWVTGNGLGMHLVSSPSFRLFGLNGTAYLRVGSLPEGWTVKAMVADGVEDVTDRPLTFSGGRTYDLRVVLTDRVTTVQGIVAEPARASADRANHSVVIFPEDADKWVFGSRYLRTVRTDAQGTFRVSGLPPDERYLAVAVNFLQDGEDADPAFLEQMRTRATPFSLAGTERRTLDLGLIQR